MPAQIRFLFSCLIFIFLFSPKIIFAQIVINEFSSNNGTDWVEVYNLSEEGVDLLEYLLVDSDGNTKNLNCVLSSEGEFSVEWSNRLNNGGDRIVLKKSEETIDCVAYGNGLPCEGKESVDLRKLEVGEYGVRDPKGVGDWTTSNTYTQADNLDCISSTPTFPPSLTPTPIPTDTPVPTTLPTPSPTPTPKTATYKINEVKNEGGEILLNVKIYIDGAYIHHYAPETLTFCNNCRCDTYVDCGFGEHTISLQKSSYQNWSDTRTIKAGDSYNINPVMSLLIPTSTPTPDLVSSTLVPTALPSITGSVLEETTKERKTPASFLQGLILGEENIDDKELISSRKQPTSSGIEKIKGIKRLQKPFLVLGALSIFIMVGSAFWVEKRRKIL